MSCNVFMKWVAALALLMLMSSCAHLSSPSVSAIKVDTSPLAVRVNDTVKVSIKAENVADLTALEVHLSFDASVLEVIQVNDGDLIKADFKVQNVFDNTAGTVDYAVAQINRPPASGSGTLFEIVFRAKASGDSSIRFRGTDATPAGVLLSDANGKAIQVTLIDGDLKVK